MAKCKPDILCQTEYETVLKKKGEPLCPPPEPCPPGSVANSDNTYSATVASGGLLALPDIEVTDVDGSTRVVPSVQDVICQDLPFTYNWPDTWNTQRASIATGDDRWQYENVWKPFFDTLPTKYRQPELDWSNIRFYTGTSHYSPDMKEDREGYGNKARLVDWDTKLPMTLTKPIIDRYTGLMFTTNTAQHGIVSTNNFATIVGDALASTYLGFDDWLPMPLQVFNTLNTTNILNAVLQPFNVGIWLANAGTSASTALIVGSGAGQVSLQNITGGFSLNIHIYRKFF